VSAVTPSARLWQRTAQGNRMACSGAGALSTWEIMRNVSSSHAIARDESERVLPPPMPSNGGGLLGDARR